MANAYDAQHHTTPHYTHGGWVGPFRALLCFLLANYTAVRTIEIGYHTIYDDWYSVQGISTCSAYEAKLSFPENIPLPRLWKIPVTIITAVTEIST